MSGTEEDTRVQIGHKDGHVILNMYGTSEVEPSYLRWTPEQAREVARQLLASADHADKRPVTRQQQMAERSERTEFIKRRLESMFTGVSGPWTFDVIIVGTRYGGIYEGAPWIAWLGDPEWLDDYQSGDNACQAFWEDYGEAPMGRGQDPNSALADLVRQAKAAQK